MMTHENGAVLSLSTSYASASEYYLMNVYGKRMSAYYNLFDGLRCLKQGETGQTAVAVEEIDTLAEVKAGIESVRQGRHVDVAEILASDG